MLGGVRTEFSDEVSDGCRTVAASNGPDEYILWLCDADGSVYFEWDDQSNSGYDTVSKVVIDAERCHLVLGERVLSFNWRSIQEPELGKFASALQELYQETPQVVSVRL